MKTCRESSPNWLDSAIFQPRGYGDEMRSAPDIEIFRRLEATGETLVTRDIRFANHVLEQIVAGSPLRGVILIREQKTRKMVDAWSGEGARFIVAKEIANRLSNAKIIPLELFFGGSGSGVFEYRDNLELLKLLKIFDTSKDIKELKKRKEK